MPQVGLSVGLCARWVGHPDAVCAAVVAAARRLAVLLDEKPEMGARLRWAEWALMLEAWAAERAGPSFGEGCR